MSKEKDTVILKIDDSSIECDKNVLTKNSNYFSVMLSGNFRESAQDCIEIKDVSLKVFNTLLMLLWDSSYEIEDEEIHLILAAACIFQFDSVRTLCEIRIKDSLRPSICLKIWKTAEIHHIKPLWVKAKSMALMDFKDIFNGSDILSFALEDLCSYLGNLYLNTKSEMTVFQSAMNWWCENQEFYDKEDWTNIILKLLNCVNFNLISNTDIKDLQEHPAIMENFSLKSILNCVIDLKQNGTNVGVHREQDLIAAIHLCNAQLRKTCEVPCILFFSVGLAMDIISKVDMEGSVVTKDKYGRKRKYHEVGTSKDGHVSASTLDISSFCYDATTDQFCPVYLIDADKVCNLLGYKLCSYKEFVFIFGGEFLHNALRWNSNMWVCNTFSEKWVIQSQLPSGRRHFESVIIDGCIFIVGGIGHFRLIKETLLYYDFKTDTWSEPHALPHKDRIFKCCSYQDQLLIVYLSSKYACLFNKENSNWSTFNLVVDSDIIQELRYFVVFATQDHLYVKGKYFIQFKLIHDEFVAIKQTPMVEFECDKMDAVLCNDTLYTLYQSRDDKYELCHSLESTDIHTQNSNFIFKYKSPNDRDIFKENNKDHKPMMLITTNNAKLFSINHYKLVEKNVYINDSIV